MWICLDDDSIGDHDVDVGGGDADGRGGGVHGGSGEDDNSFRNITHCPLIYRF